MKEPEKVIKNFIEEAEKYIKLYESIAKDKALESIMGKSIDKEKNIAEARGYMLRVSTWREALNEIRVCSK